MIKEIEKLAELFDNPKLIDTSIIKWGAPIPSFGRLQSSKIATLGLNPSNLEFMDVKGNELHGQYRRFHTLSSLGLESWDEIKEEHIIAISKLCEEYFNRNPYDRWFKKLDYLISGTSFSYYFPSEQACHLDIVPFATSKKWSELSHKQKLALLNITGDFLGLLLKNSPIKVIVLNGRTVLDYFQELSKKKLHCVEKPNWSLPRKRGNGVMGYAYSGTIKKIGKVNLSKEILVLGYNHNIQSSFGVTKQVQTSIRNWITEQINILDEVF